MLVSEVMLQQTQVARVLPRWRAFLDRFPDPASCARASRAEVIAAWRGLGYNRRAVHLHEAARRIVDEYGGQVPHELDALLGLPGVGPYVARAVRVFAFGTADGVVDANVRRVLCRAVVGEQLAAGALQRLADALVPAERSWWWNQALIDLGATVCRTRRPDCDRCPLRSVCTWAARGYPPPDPGRQPRTQPPFAGSDRQGRGRLLDALRDGPVAVEELPLATGWPTDPARARRVADALVRDGLARYDAGRLVLPDD